jgi:hypothetical protein
MANVPQPDPSTMTPKPPPSFEAMLDRAVLSNAQRIELLLLRQFDPISAGLKLGGIIAGQLIACSMAADEELDG